MNHALLSLLRLKIKTIAFTAFGLLVVCAYILTIRSIEATRRDLGQMGSQNANVSNQQECPEGFTPLPNSAYCSNLKGMLVAKSKQIDSPLVVAK